MQEKWKQTGAEKMANEKSEKLLLVQQNTVTSNHELVVGENLVQQETSHSLSTSLESIDNKSREISVTFRHKYKPDKELGISKESNNKRTIIS